MIEEAFDMPVVIEKARLNVWNLGGFIIGIAVTTFGWGITYNTINQQIEITRDQQKEHSARIKNVENKIPQFEVIGLQIQRLTEMSAGNQKAIEETNNRLTRVVESQSDKFDAIISRLSDLTTEIRVVQSQLKEKNIGDN